MIPVGKVNFIELRNSGNSTLLHYSKMHQLIKNENSKYQIHSDKKETKNLFIK